jgi:hypothetical protein
MSASVPSRSFQNEALASGIVCAVVFAMMFAVVFDRLVEQM